MTDEHAPHGPERRRLSRGVITGMAAGAVVLVGGVIAAIAVLLPRLEEVAATALGGEPDARVLETRTTAGWSTMPVMGGAATVKFDPGWGDIAKYVDGQAVEAEMTAQEGVDVAFHGAWLVAGDIEGDNTVLMALSVEDAGGPSTPQVEASSFIRSSTFGIDGAAATVEGPVRTARDYPGYVAEYQFPMSDDTMMNSVGVVVEGTRQLMVFTVGSSSTGSGAPSMEAVLNSLEIA